MTIKLDNPMVFVYLLSLDDVVWTGLKAVWEVELSAQVSQGVIVAIKKMDEYIPRCDCSCDVSQLTGC